jgi:hypothetical protein
MTQLPPLSDLGRLSHAEKDALIIALWTRVNQGLARVEELTAGVAGNDGHVIAPGEQRNAQPDIDGMMISPSFGPWRLRGAQLRHLSDTLL